MKIRIVCLGKAGLFLIPQNAPFLRKGLKNMKCSYHPDKEAVGICQTFNEAYCAECCACRHAQGFCKYRPQCIIWHLAKIKFS